MQQPELRIVYLDEDQSVKFRRTMHDWDEVQATYFVDNQMDLELDYGHVVISAQKDDLRELGLRILELTDGAELEDEALAQFREDMEYMLSTYDRTEDPRW